MDSRDVLQRWSKQQGWPPAAERQLLLNFLDSQGQDLVARLDRWLGEVAAEENAPCDASVSPAPSHPRENDP
jgi:hypothetical protein